MKRLRASRGVALVTSDERTIHLARRKVDDLVRDNLAWWIGPDRARMYHVEHRTLRSRQSAEPGEGGPQTLQLVDA
jgi:hypothetical protein